jgi:hypothetical protein
LQTRCANAVLDASELPARAKRAKTGAHEKMTAAQLRKKLVQEHGLKIAPVHNPTYPQPLSFPGASPPAAIPAHRWRSVCAGRNAQGGLPRPPQAAPRLRLRLGRRHLRPLLSPRRRLHARDRAVLQRGMQRHAAAARPREPRDVLRLPPGASSPPTRSHKIRKDGKSDRIRCRSHLPSFMSLCYPSTLASSVRLQC